MDPQEKEYSLLKLILYLEQQSKKVVPIDAVSSM
jgi:hypothetical protein